MIHERKHRSESQASKRSIEAPRHILAPDASHTRCIARIARIARTHIHTHVRTHARSRMRIANRQHLGIFGGGGGGDLGVAGWNKSPGGKRLGVPPAPLRREPGPGSIGPVSPTARPQSDDVCKSKVQ